MKSIYKLSIFVLALLAISNVTFSQAPNYYFQNNPVWQVKHTMMVQTPCGVVLTREYFIASTDTLIAGNLYKRLMKKEQSLGTQVLTQPPFTPFTCPNPQAPYYQSTPQLYAYVRSVGKQIFIRQLSSINTEQLLYDFNLNVGSTTTTSCLGNTPQTITFIDSVSTPNGFRKRYYANSNLLVFVEGIGHPAGLVPPELMQGNVSGFGSQFMCYQQNGTFCNVGMGGANCSALSIEKNEPLKSEFSVYPNPIQTNGLITFTNEVKNGELFIYNAIGKEVRHTKGINGLALKIERADLTNGVYFFSIKQKETEVFKGKFVVAD